MPTILLCDRVDCTPSSFCVMRANALFSVSFFRTRPPGTNQFPLAGGLLRRPSSIALCASSTIRSIAIRGALPTTMAKVRASSNAALSGVACAEDLLPLTAATPRRGLVSLIDIFSHPSLESSPDQNAEIHQERPVLDVVQIELHAFFHFFQGVRFPSQAMNLGPTG